MKKIWILLLALVIFSACEKKEPENLDPVVQNKYQMVADSTVDIDLTVMSSTMVYGEVNTMMVEPDSYEGKSVKMRGDFSLYTDDYTKKTYFACIIKDATACCAQGLEFVLSDEDSRYPEVGTEITVKGIFESYEEDGYYYCRLRDAQII